MTQCLSLLMISVPGFLALPVVNRQRLLSVQNVATYYFRPDPGETYNQHIDDAYELTRVDDLLLRWDKGLYQHSRYTWIVVGCAVSSSATSNGRNLYICIFS